MSVCADDAGQTHAVDSTEAGQVPELPTEIVTSDTSEISTVHAWADVPDDETVRVRLISRVDWQIVVGVIVALAIAAVSVAVTVVLTKPHHVPAADVRNPEVTHSPAPPSAGKSATTGLLPPPPPPAPPATTAVTPLPVLRFPPDAWDRFIVRLNSRGLDIDPAERDYDDKANRQLCRSLFGSSDPAFRTRLIQESIVQSEGGSWGELEAAHAIHSALQAYCPQFDR